MNPSRSKPGSDRSADGVWRDESGVAGVEFALSATLLVCLALVAADASMAITSRMQIENAAQAGAEYASINGGNQATDNGISSAISTAATNATWLTPSVTPTLRFQQRHRDPDLHNTASDMRVRPNGRYLRQRKDIDDLHPAFQLGTQWLGP
ncbi:MAG TPA: TadE/TadG family type IV pilus assembly protein [Roseiarcus sp.]|nr:TadE/TadG family type IV pilus assembly protein [Roseiarcus sp.]